MKKWYNVVGMGALLIASAQSFAQTQYGAGAGTQGIDRAFFGTNAGSTNTGVSNTFIGHEAGSSNGDNVANTYVGAVAGKSAKTSFGVFIGSAAGAFYQGNSVVYIGTRAGMSAKGNENIFVGTDAGRFNKGEYNVGIGLLAGFKNTGKGNTFVGNNSGATVDFGELNSFFGYNSGLNTTTGKENTFLGVASGNFNETGSENSFVGASSGFNNVSGNRNSFFGEFSGYHNTFGSFNAFVGYRAGSSNISGTGNAFLGYGAGYDNATGSNNTYLGYAAGGYADLQNATAIGALSKVTASNSIVLGNNANVGIGISAPQYQLQLNTDLAAKSGSPTWKVASDRRLKKDISEYTDGLEMLKQITPVWFSYNGEAGIRTGDKKFVGVIAQEMQRIASYTVGSFVYQDSLGHKTEYLDYDANAVTYMLVNAVKEQQQIIDEKDAKIQDLTSRLENVERMVSSLAGKPLNAQPGAKEDQGASLQQNSPNGFSKSTSIKYFIPQDVKNAVIEVYAVDGRKVGTYPIAERGVGELHLSASQLKLGIHVYELITDGRSAGAKKMLVE